MSGASIPFRQGFISPIAPIRPIISRFSKNSFFSPVVNSLLFGMPAAAMLPIILTKSVFLALAASMMATMARSVALWAVAASVVAYQALGFVAEWIISGSLFVALQDIRIGWPGILVQVFGGYAVMKYVIKK